MRGVANAFHTGDNFSIRVWNKERRRSSADGRIHPCHRGEFYRWAE